MPHLRHGNIGSWSFSGHDSHPHPLPPSLPLSLSVLVPGALIVTAFSSHSSCPSPLLALPLSFQNVVRLDGDENASTAVIILTDLYKMFPTQLVAQSRTFVDTMIERFRGLQALVAQAFGGDRVCDGDGAKKVGLGDWDWD
jgi:hypothetical protein